MDFLTRVEKKFGRYAVPNVTIYLIAGQTVFYLLFMTGKLDRSLTTLAAALLERGEWWRAITFLFDPPVQNPLFAFFAWYLFYLMGSALEEHWGAFRYNVFLLIGYLLTVAVSFLIPAFPVTNAYIGGSVFLAFAWLYPDFTLQLFFVLPVQIKWLALLTWIYYGWSLIFGGWATRLVILASVGNFLIFFARDISWTMKNGRRRMERQARNRSGRGNEPFHRCTVCGITDRSHPTMDFRYCPECTGQRGYCREHLFSHDHIRE